MSDPYSINPRPQHWFALIGVDFYMPAAGGPRLDAENHPVCFPSLRGCVRDVEQVREYIISQLKVDPSHIYTLTSTGTENGSEPKEKTTDLPTYGNIVSLFERIADEAQVGDIVYIHYSGHGARVKTSYQDLKGPNGLDEAIVPPDIACGGQYLLDVEIAILLYAMTKKRLIVTVVLDCCHSGSITPSSGEPNCRGIEQIDALATGSHQRTAIPIPQDQPELMNSLKTTYGTVGGGVWCDPQGYELFAACRPGKKAYEKCYEDGHWHGVLTYNLLASLKLGGANLTHGMLEQRLRATVAQEKSSQTPIFAGNKHRYLFSSDERQHTPTIAVTHVDGKNVILAAGKAHAVLCGSEYAIYPWNVNDFSDSNRRPKVRVIEVHNVESTAELFELPHADELIEPSFQAVPLVPELAVKLFSSSSDRLERYKFYELQAEISRNAPHCPVELVYGPEKTAAYHVKVDNGRYKLLNTSNEPISKFPPSTDPKPFLHNLKHLARYEMLRNLKNSTAPANLWAKIKFELDVPYLSTNTMYRDRTIATLRFTNSTEMALNLTIFDFQPRWGIKKLFPAKMEYDAVDPGDCITCKVELYQPENWDPKSPDHVDYLKAFITVRPTPFSCLELPPLNTIYTASRNGLMNDSSDLEKLLNTLGVGNRHARLVGAGLGDWMTAEIEIWTISDEANAEDEAGLENKYKVPGAWPED